MQVVKPSRKRERKKEVGGIGLIAVRRRTASSCQLRSGVAALWPQLQLMMPVILAWAALARRLDPFVFQLYK